jgi:FkbM family methyltransferase
MRIMFALAKKLQFLDATVPLRWRVPFRFWLQRLVGGLEPEMQLLPDLVPEDKIAVDIGGNRGTYAYALSKLARHVLTFEPVPACTRLLHAWAHDKNVTVHECGLGDREDTLVLHVPRLKGTLFTTRASFSRTEGEGIDFPVAIKTLDQFGLEDVGFIKIDVEGFEFATLKGAQETLRRCRPNLLVEIDTKQQSREAFNTTFEWLESMGYEGHYLEGGKLHAGGADVQSDQLYRCNFIFLPTGPI